MMEEGLRAVIYCRCSTEEESQIDALNNQVKEAENCVSRKKWLLVDKYIESKSGTSTKGRSEYNRLYGEILIDKFDVIVIKSQDRLARNTKDWYLFVDRLTSNGKKLFIYIEDKFYSTDDALITGIKAILAEEYSRELSKKILNAHRNRQKNNGKAIITSNVYGLRRLADRTITIVEEEAAIKRRMYQLCAAGYGCKTISNILKNEGIYNRQGKAFTSSAILRMIRNPLNMGTVVMNKRHFEFDSKKTVRTKPEEQYVYENKVPAIVSKELWEQANRYIDSRVVKNKQVPGNLGLNPGKTLLSGKLICGLCGDPFYRRSRKKYNSNDRIYDWMCKKYIEEGRNNEQARPKIRKVDLFDKNGCSNIHLSEERLYKFLEEIATDQYRSKRDLIISKMLSYVKKVMSENDSYDELKRWIKKQEKIKNQMNILLEKLLSNVIKDDIYRLKQQDLENELDSITANINKIQQGKQNEHLVGQRIIEIEKTLKDDKILGQITVFKMLDEIDKIYIYPTYMEIEFNVFSVFCMSLGYLDNEKNRYKMKFEYGQLFNYKNRKMEQRNQIIECMREQPTITAKKIARKMGIGLAAVNYGINVLKKENKIWYDGKGGRGEWKINETQ